MNFPAPKSKSSNRSADLNWRSASGGVILKFAVSDTGEGISSEAQMKLFADYTQASMDVARKHGGTGLGLAICRRLIGLMGGEISVESAAGEGSTFSFISQFDIVGATETAEFLELSNQQKTPSEAVKADTLRCCCDHDSTRKETYRWDGHESRPYSTPDDPHRLAR